MAAPEEFTAVCRIADNSYATIHTKQRQVTNYLANSIGAGVDSAGAVAGLGGFNSRVAFSSFGAIAKLLNAPLLSE